MLILMFSPRKGTIKLESKGPIWLADEDEPIEEDLQVIFIGGPMRSGTTLTAALLDALPSISCGRESALIPKILDWMSREYRPKLSGKPAAISGDVVDKAVRGFITSMLFSGTKLDAVKVRLNFRPCKKDPFTMIYAGYLSQLFPKSKFVLLIRDGRDVAQSIVTHNFIADWSSYNRNLKLWNQEMRLMISSCKAVGPDRCYPLFYEQLVLNPEPNLKSLLEFLGLPWHDDILRHHQIVPQKFSSTNDSAAADGWVDTVSHAIHNAPVGRWLRYLEENPGVTIDYSVAPLIAKLGYDTVEKVDDYRKIKQVDFSPGSSLFFKNRLFWRS